jgi:phosphatidylglycerol:prolipoprotein diacylglycerol transferase
MYAVAYIVIYFVTVRRLRKEDFSISKSDLIGALTWSIVGLAVGARLFYVLFYEPGYYLANPLQIIWPFSEGGQLTGISGLSYHGGLVGIIVATLLFCKKEKISVWELTDLVIPVIPLGYTFGRLGNFINGELFGRATNVPWGMYFPSDALGLLRHPSQLYEAFLEGIVLFVILWMLRKRVKGSRMVGVYMIGYAVARFIAEFFRQPDPQLGFVYGSFTMGQLFSILMIIGGILLYLMNRRSLLYKAPVKR